MHSGTAVVVGEEEEEEVSRVNSDECCVNGALARHTTNCNSTVPSGDGGRRG